MSEPLPAEKPVSHYGRLFNGGAYTDPQLWVKWDDYVALHRRCEHAEQAARSNAAGWKEALEELRKLERDTSRALSNHLDDLNED